MLTELIMLYRMAPFSVILSDPNYTQTTRFSAFGIAFHIFVIGGDRDFKVSRQDPEMDMGWVNPWVGLGWLGQQIWTHVHLRQVDRSKSYRMDDKSS